MFKRFLVVVMVAFTMVGFASISEAASEGRVEEIHEVLIQEAKREETNTQIYTISLVKVNDHEYFKTYKILIDGNIEEHFVRYADSITGSIKKSYHWREKDGKYEKSPHDKPAKIYTHWK